jgi:hypothetical protein
VLGTPFPEHGPGRELHQDRPHGRRRDVPRDRPEGGRREGVQDDGPGDPGVSGQPPTRLRLTHPGPSDELQGRAEDQRVGQQRERVGERVIERRHRGRVQAVERQHGAGHGHDRQDQRGPHP